MPVFFINSTNVEDDDKIAISDPLYTHIVKSLRSRVGDALVLNDENGRRYHTSIIHITKRAILSKITRIETRPHTLHPPLILAQAVLKGEKMSWVIQKATELGIHTIVPLITERVIPRFPAYQLVNLRERWERICVEAAQQSERWAPPAILTPQRFHDVLDAKPSGMPIILAERGEYKSLSQIQLDSDHKTGLTVYIGPEGGWAPHEIHLAGIRGFTFATLGEKILRAETASLASIAILQAKLQYF